MSLSKWRRALCAAAIGLMAVMGNAHATSAYKPGTTYQYKQPDGKTITVKLTGDGHYAEQRTLDGSLLVYDPTLGGLAYAQVNAAGDDLVSTKQLAKEPTTKVEKIQPGLGATAVSIKVLQSRLKKMGVQPNAISTTTTSTTTSTKITTTIPTVSTKSAIMPGAIATTAPTLEDKRADLQQQFDALLAPKKSTLTKSMPGMPDVGGIEAWDPQTARKRGTKQAFVGLTLLIDFTDNDFANSVVTPETIRAHLNDTHEWLEEAVMVSGKCPLGSMLNTNSGKCQYGSLFSYYKKVSGGNLEYTNIVNSRVFRMSKPMSYYNSDKGQDRTLENELLREVLTTAVNEMNLSGLTMSSKNISLVNIIYPGEMGGTVNTWGSGLWPHYVEERAFKDPVCFKDRCINNFEITNGGVKEFALSTLIHENGHQLYHWPDLYDSDPAPDKSAGLGDFDLMAEHWTYPPINPYFRMMAGWDEVIELNPNFNPDAPRGRISIDSSKRQVYRFSRNENEAFYFDNFDPSQAQYSRAPDSGLAIFKVNLLRQGNQNDQFMPFMQIIQADGKRQLQSNENHGDSTDLFDQSTPLFDATHPEFTGPMLSSPVANSNWGSPYLGMKSGITLSGFSAPGRIISFNLGLDGDKYCAAGFTKDKVNTCWEKCTHGTDIGTICSDISIYGKTAQVRDAGSPLVCPPGSEQNGALCYPPCNSGFDGVGPVCWQRCPQGTDFDSGAFCTRWPHGHWQWGWLWWVDDWGWTRAKQTYWRSAGSPLSACPAGKVRDGALCYNPCPSNTKGVGPVCWGICTSGYTDDGLTCRRDRSYQKSIYSVTPPP